MDTDAWVAVDSDGTIVAYGQAASEESEVVETGATALSEGVGMRMIRRWGLWERLETADSPASD